MPRRLRSSVQILLRQYRPGAGARQPAPSRPQLAVFAGWQSARRHHPPSHPNRLAGPPAAPGILKTRSPYLATPYEPAWPFIFLSVDTRLNFLYNQGRMVCPILANRRYGGVSKFLSACTAICLPTHPYWLATNPLHKIQI